MNFVSDVFDAISNGIGTVFSYLNPFINQAQTWLTSAQGWANGLITSAQGFSFPDYIKGPLVLLSYIPWLLITALVYVCGWILSFIAFFTNNPDIVTYGAIFLGVLFLEGYGPIKEYIEIVPYYHMITLALFALPVLVFVWQYYTVGQDVPSAVAATKTAVFNFSFSIFSDYPDIFIYIGIFIASAYLSTSPTILGYEINFIPQIVFFAILVALMYPIVLFVYYVGWQKQNLNTALQSVRQNAIPLVTNNLDVGVYLVIVFLALYVVFNQGTQNFIQSLIPDYLLVNLGILIFVILALPLGVVLYYTISQTKIPLSQTISVGLGGTVPPNAPVISGSVSFFDGITLLRADTSSILQNLGFIQTNLTKITTQAPRVRDINPGLTDTERMFFAQLYSDNPTGYPVSIYYPASVPNYSGSYAPMLPNNSLTYKSKPGTYDTLYYEDINLEFFGNPSYQESLYSQFFGQRMTRADYISVPYLTLSGKSISNLDGGVTISTAMLKKLTTLCFDLMNLLNADGTSKYTTLSSIPDYILQSFATGQDCSGANVPYKINSYNPSFVCYDAINSRSQYPDAAGIVWPGPAAQALLWPTISSSNIKQQLITGIPTPTQIAACNQAFIYYSFIELINNLSSITSGYLESVQRWNIYLQIWGADNLSNPNFVKTPSELGSYVYTYANMSKNIVMFNDFLSCSLLPTSDSNAITTQSFNLNNAYNAGIYNQILVSNNPNSSGLLFKIADTVLELIASGVQLSSVIGLYNNVRQTNANFLFNTATNPNNGVSGFTTGNFSYVPTPVGTSSYSADVLNSIDQANRAAASGTLVGSNIVTATAQIQTVLNSFASSVDKTKIAQALQDAPIQSTTNTNDYGSSYVRRLFYDAAGLMSTIYSDIFAILKTNVFFSGNQYVPTANDPIDMSWFRYTVQNWNNSFDGTQFGDGSYNPKTDKIDGCNSYVCGGYQDGAIHINQIKAVLSALDTLIFTNNTTNYLGIYDRIYSLLDYVVSYNNIVNKSFTLGLLGSSASNNLQNLINNLSNRYLRLNQNNRYMDLTSLLPNNVYQHYHMNLDLSVPKFSVNPVISSTGIQTISSVANLRTWLAANVSNDPAYTAFKNEIATVFVYKIVWDMVWWPQFCTEYYYNNTGTATGQNPLIRQLYWQNTSTTPRNQMTMNTIAQGYLSYGFYALFQDYGAARLSSQFFTPAICPNLANLISGVYPAGYATGLYDRNLAPAVSGSLPAINTYYWKSICYSHMHDLIIPYVFFTGTILPDYTKKCGPQNYSSIINTSAYNADLYYQYYGDNNLFGFTKTSYSNNMNLTGTFTSPNLPSYSNAISSYRWLSNYTCIGSNSSGSQFPKQMIFDKTINTTASYIDPFYATVYSGSYGGPVPPSSTLFTKFNCMAKDRNTMRKQFFADPFSWFDINKCYRIYPIAHGMNFPGNYEATDTTTTWLTQDVNPMRVSYTNQMNGLGIPALYYCLGSSGFASSVQAYDYASAYAPIQDISMVSGS